MSGPTSDALSALRIHDLATLLAAISAGESPSFVLFWGHTPGPDGAMGKHCLSQWYPASFEDGGTTYASAEHFMMAEKARLFGDEATRAEILAASTPAAAKKLGRKVRDFDRGSWEARRFEIVVRGSLAKFRAHRDLGDYLAGTADQILVEASPEDAIWGIGLGASQPEAQDPRQWRGLNLLGFALMEARRALRARP